MFSLTKQALEDLREIGRYTQKRWDENSVVTTLLCWTDVSILWRKIRIKASGVTKSVLGTANFLPVSMSFFTANRLPVALK